MSGAVHPSLTLTAAERADLVSNPEAFARRAEAVLSAVVQKLHKLEAERHAEKVDAERRYHQLERGQATLRDEHEKAVAEHRKISSERQAMVDARDAAMAESSRLTSELRSAKAEVARLKDSEREGAEKRQRLVQINERKRTQIEATERDLASAHTALAAAKRAAADAERKASEAEAEALQAKMQVCAAPPGLSCASESQNGGGPAALHLLPLSSPWPSPQHTAFVWPCYS